MKKDDPNRFHRPVHERRPRKELEQPPTFAGLATILFFAAAIFAAAYVFFGDAPTGPTVSDNSSRPTATAPKKPATQQN